MNPVVYEKDTHIHYEKMQCVDYSSSGVYWWSLTLAPVKVTSSALL